MNDTHPLPSGEAATHRDAARRALSLTLFGAFEARLGDAAIPDLQKRDGERLLALLTLQHGHPLKTELISERLWPASGSLDSLHQAVSHLRRALAEHAWRLQSPKGILLFDLEGVKADVIAFDSAVVSRDIDSLKLAVGLCQRGALLEGWDEVKDPWILQEREKRRRKHLDALKLVAADRMAHQDPAGAVTYLRQYVNLNPTEERGWCDLMKALVQSGERLSAISLYENCRKYTQTKYKLDPPAEMTDLLRRIHSETAAPPEESPQDAGTLSAPRGALLLQSQFYVERPTDKLFADALLRHESIVLVKGPRQTGKTSLLARSLQHARATGSRVVLTDLQSLGEEHWTSTEAFCRALAQDLADQLDLPVQPADVWNPSRGPNRNLQRYLCEQALAHTPASLVWGIDEVDRLFAYPFSTAVFALFRSWHNARALEPHQSWDRLTLAMAYATEVHLLIDDLNQSPFNVGLQLTLHDFTLDQISNLSARYGSPLESEDQLQRFYQLVGGSPYLVHRGLYELATRPMDITSLEAEAAHESGCYGDHLQRMEHALLHDASLCSVVRGLLAGSPCPDEKSFYRLKSAGILVGDEPRTAAWRSSIYKDYLQAHLQ